MSVAQEGRFKVIHNIHYLCTTYTVSNISIFSFSALFFPPLLPSSFFIMVLLPRKTLRYLNPLVFRARFWGRIGNAKVLKLSART